MNFFSFIRSLLNGRDETAERPPSHVILAEMKDRGDRTEARTTELREARLSGVEKAFLPPLNHSRENGYAE